MIIEHEDSFEIKIYRNLLERRDTEIDKLADKIFVRLDADGRTYRGFIKDPYFKVYDNVDINKAKHITRINMYSPTYVIHNNQKWNLDSEEKKSLIKLLNAETKSGITVWDKLKQEAETLSKSQNIDAKDIEKLRKADIPDYKEL